MNFKNFFKPQEYKKKLEGNTAYKILPTSAKKKKIGLFTSWSHENNKEAKKKRKWNDMNFMRNNNVFFL